jgi:putative ABC transport system permease protein
VDIQEWEDGAEGGLEEASYPNFSDWRAQATMFESMSAYATGELTVTGRGEPAVVDAAFVSGNLFTTLAVLPLEGRLLRPADDVVGAERVAVLSAGLASRLFGFESAVGAGIRLDDELYTVVGVTHEDFEFPISADTPQVWTPLFSEVFISRNSEGRGSHLLDVIARLRSDVRLERAEAELQQIAAALAVAYPETNTGQEVRIQPYQDALTGAVRGGLFVLLGAVAGVLLIACANVAGLLLVKGISRRREIAIRAALGAPRLRIVRQLLVESLILAALGGTLGVLLASWGLDALIATASADVPRLAQVGIDGPVLLFSVGLTLLTSVSFGLLPAWQGAAVRLQLVLADKSSRGSAGGHQVRLRQSIVVAEVAVALVLVTGAGLLIRSFAELRRVDPGFAPQKLLTGAISLPWARYGDASARELFQRNLLEELMAEPGVSGAAAVAPLPLSGNSLGLSFEIEGRPIANPGERPSAQFYAASPQYFSVMGIPLRRGRLLDERDRDESAPVLLISDTFARKYFADGDPLGHRLRIGLNDFEGEIVGVVGDIKRDGLDAEAVPQMYTAFAQTSLPFFDIVIAAQTTPESGARALRRIVSGLDESQAISRIRPMQEYVSRAIAQPRFNAVLLTAFGGLALLLSALGIYGVMGYSVAQRTREFGIRMALGADGVSIRRSVVGQGVRLAGIGVGLGGLAAVFATRLLEGLLFGVHATDVLTYTVATATLFATAVAASYLPARRATRTDPLRALRDE